MSTHSAGEKLTAKIVKTYVREIGDKDAVEIRAELPSGEVIGALIFLTPKAASMARAQLKSCGFDADTQSLADLANNDHLLDGNLIDVESDEYNGKIQWKIRTGVPVPKGRMKAHDDMLRAAKDRGGEVTSAASAAIASDDLPF